MYLSGQKSNNPNFVSKLGLLGGKEREFWYDVTSCYFFGDGNTRLGDGNAGLGDGNTDYYEALANWATTYGKATTPASRT